MGFNPFAAGGGAGGDYVHNYTTFDDLGIDTHRKTMEAILKEIADMNLPVNTIITGQLYTEAAPDERIYNCEGEIQITQGKYGQVYWCRATSASISPYSWDSIYNQTTDEDNPIDNILPWTPTYYQSTEINEIKKKLEELGADWVGRFERDENGNILGEYFNDYENNKATGLYSHTEGSMNVNLGETGHVEGYNNKLNSTEKGSHIEGMENVVEGECNHTEGRGNTVHGTQNHVSGSGNSVNGVGNFVCGQNVTIGNNTAYNFVSPAVDEVTIGSLAIQNVRSNAILNGDTHTINGSYNICGIGSSNIVSYRNVDFGQGSAIKNKGDNAILCGSSNKLLSGKYIVDNNYDPDDTNRTGQYNAVIGSNNIIYASSTYTFGDSNTIGVKPTEDNKTPNVNSSRFSLIMGQGNTSLGQCCIVDGFGNNIKEKSFSLVMGTGNTINQNCCLVCGIGNTITTDGGGDEGVLVIGSGNSNITDSRGALLLGSGGNSIVNSRYIYMSGGSNTAKNANYSIISGGANKVYSADYSYVLGTSNNLGAENNDSVSKYVFLFGNNLKASGEQNKIISGAFNAIDTEDKFALVIGNGTADDARSNAFAVSKTGDIYVKNSDTPIDLAPISMSLLEEICV